MKATRRQPQKIEAIQTDDVLQFVPETDLLPVRELLAQNADLLEVEDKDLTDTQRVRLENLPSVADMVRAANKKRLDELPPEIRAQRLANPSGSAKWMDAA